MPAMRRIVMTAAALLIALAAPIAITSTAAAQSPSIECDNDWHTPCP